MDRSPTSIEDPPALVETPAHKPRARLVLAHGAGAPMTSPFMSFFAEGLASRGISVVRFEFAFMAARRMASKRPPAPKAERLVGEYEAVAAQAADNLPLFIGGKSLGGRVASMIADKLYGYGRIQGIVALGYPFHPAKRPETLRTAHLESLKCPALIVQGDRDPLGSLDEVSAYRLSAAIEIAWIADGDHDLAVRRKSGRDTSQAWNEALDAVGLFVSSRVGR